MARHTWVDTIVVRQIVVAADRTAVVAVETFVDEAVVFDRVVVAVVADMVVVAAAVEAVDLTAVVLFG